MTDQVCENNNSKNFFDKMFYFVAVFSKKNKLDYAESYKVILEKVTQRTSKENKYCENLLFLIQTIKTSPKRLMDITNEVKELPDMNDDELISGIIENFYEFANIEFNKKIFLHP
jgi:hypothetical protein